MAEEKMTFAIESPLHISESKDLSNMTLSTDRGEERTSRDIDEYIEAIFAQGDRPLRETVPNLRETRIVPHLSDLLSTRADHCLMSVGVDDWDKLLAYSPEGLFAVRNMGLTTIREIVTLVVSQFLDQLTTTQETERDRGFGKRTLGEIYPDLKVADDAPFPIERVTTRAANQLTAARIVTWGALLKLSAEDLLAVPNMGELSVRNIVDVVSHLASRNQIPTDVAISGSLEEIVADFVRGREGHTVGNGEIQRTALASSGRRLNPRFRQQLQLAIDNLVESESVPIVKVGRSSLRWAEAGNAPERVREMIQLRWEEWTLEQIAEHFSLTRERVRQLIKEWGGPSPKEVKELRNLRAAKERVDQLARVGSQIRSQIAISGPMSVEEVVAQTGLEVDQVVHGWPEDLWAYQLRPSTPSEAIQRWSDTNVMEALRVAAIYSFPLGASDYDELVGVGEVDGPTSARIVQRYGTWITACEAAGVEPRRTVRTGYDSKWTDDDLLSYVRAYFHEPVFMGVAQRYDEWRRQYSPDAPSFGTLRNRIGTWTQIRRAALSSSEVDGV